MRFSKSDREFMAYAEEFVADMEGDPHQSDAPTDEDCSDGTPRSDDKSPFPDSPNFDPRVADFRGQIISRYGEDPEVPDIDGDDDSD